MKINIARDLNTKVIGLMGKKNITEGLLIPKCNAVHTYNMLDNIDILFLDNNKILFHFVNVLPNQIIVVNKNTSVLELPKYTSINYHIGDYLSFLNSNI